MDYKAFDVVVVPFPFADSAQSRRRPAVVLSDEKCFNNFINHSILAMITSAKNSPWPLDVFIDDLTSAGLPTPSVIRMKLFTLDHRFIIRKAGSLSRKDQIKLMKSTKLLLQ